MTRRRTWFFLGASLSVSLATLDHATRTVGSVADRPLAIVGATVIPMTEPSEAAARNEIRLPNYTVLIRSGKIVALGQSDSIRLPANVQRIDGRGRFLIPGLVDAHAHLMGVAAAADLPLYLLNGVTTVRNMYGEPYHLRWRREIATGVLLGPTLFTTSALTDGLPTPEKARAFVRRARDAGYDAIKFHAALAPGVYDALTTAAHSDGIPVVGHTPGRPLGIAKAVRAKQRTIEHAESIMQAETTEEQPDVADIARVVALLHGSGICVTPTLVAFDHVVQMTEQYPSLHDLLARPEMDYVRAELRSDWEPTRNEYVTRWRGHESELPGALTKFRRQYSWMRDLVAAFAAAGVPILAGTDASIPTVVPGFSLHEELRLLVAAGVPPYAALRAATANAAACFGHAEQFGVIRPGARADLVLLDRDPLVDISAAAQPRAIVVRGRWLPRDTLVRLIARRTY